MLVSVCVTTYQSAKYVIETLESVFNQSYPELELIVSDDASTDDTLVLVNNWVKKPTVIKRFQKIEIITVPKNTGVSANCNRCIQAAHSSWVKFIAGDDILLPNCIEDNMTFVANNPEAKIVFSQVKVYRNNFEEENYVRTTPANYPNNLMDQKFSANDQFQLLLVSDRIHYTPSYFFNKQALAKVGNYDEANRLVEDYPMWLKLTRAGIKLSYFHKHTVGYRIHKNALNNIGENLLFKPSVLKGFEVRKVYVHPYLPKRIVWQEAWVYQATKLFKLLNIKKKTNINNRLYKGLTIYANPFLYYNSLFRRL